MRRTSTIAAVALAAAMFAPAGRAYAYDVNGIGIGADLSLGGPSGLALNIGFGAFEIEFIGGMVLSLPEGSVLQPDMALAVGFFATIAGGDTTNLQIGGRVGALLDASDRPAMTPGEVELETEGGISLEADLRLEHRLDDHAVLNFQVGFAVNIWPDGDGPDATPRADFGATIGGTGLVGGAGFRWYFDSLGPAAAPAPEPARTYTGGGGGGATTTTTTTAPAEGGGTTEGGGQPYWE